MTAVDNFVVDCGSFRMLAGKVLNDPIPYRWSNAGRPVCTLYSRSPHGRQNHGSQSPIA